MLRDKAGLKLSEISMGCIPATNDAQKRALAGTGTPIKELVWRVSLLNLARRNAENTEIRNAV